MILYLGITWIIKYQFLQKISSLDTEDKLVSFQISISDDQKSFYFLKMMANYSQEKYMKYQFIYIQLIMFNEKIQEIFLIIIFGAPASGKTTLSKKLKNIFPSALQISGDKIESHFHKNEEEVLPGQLNNFFDSLEKKNLDKVPFSSENWKKSRKFIESSIANLIKVKSIILEDDLLLRSQRRVFQRIASEHQIHYLQIQLSVSFNTCLQNYEKRKKKGETDHITEQIISKAHQKIENVDHKFGVSLGNIHEFESVQMDWIVKRLRRVLIPAFDEAEKQQGEKSERDKKEIQVRNFVGSIMKLNQTEISQRLGIDKVNKNEFGKILSNWKKYYLSHENESLSPEISLIQWL